MTDPGALLSVEQIPPQERLIFPLDVPSHDEARSWVDRLGDSVHFYKLGLELFLAGHYQDFVEELRKRGKQVFVDLKFFDVPETVAAAVRQLTQSGARFASVHANEAMIEAACRVKADLQILAVTVLTSLDRDDVKDLGFDVSIETLVLSRARRMLAVGADGVISSGIEARALREGLGKGFLVVSPGIRPVENRRVDDQKRVVSVEEAFRSGADYIVVGRPIRNARDPVAKAWEIQETISGIFAA